MKMIRLWVKEKVGNPLIFPILLSLKIGIFPSAMMFSSATMFLSVTMFPSATMFLSAMMFTSPTGLI
jgi:hypothetical protein